MQSNKQFLFSLTLATLVLGVSGFVLYSIVVQSGLVGNGGDNDDTLLATDSSTANGGEASAALFDGHLVYDLYVQEPNQEGVPVQSIDARVYSVNEMEIQDTQLYSNRIFYGVDTTSAGSGVGIIRDPSTDRDIALDFDFAADEYHEIATQLDANVRSVFVNDEWYIGEALTRAVLTDQDVMDLGFWSVFIYNKNTKESVFIPDASSPQFLADGAGVLYVKSDGVYKYPFGTQETSEELVPSQLIGLTARDEIAVSPEGQYMVMTQPDSGMYRVFELTPGGLVTLQEVVDDNTIFTSPIFHPVNNQAFALVTYPIDKQNNYVLQFSTIANNTPTQLIENTVESLFMVTITDWTTDNPASNL